jgi:hypothetical protein
LQIDGDSVCQTGEEARKARPQPLIRGKESFYGRKKFFDRGGFMELQKGTKAYKAVEAGKNAYAQGLGRNDNPYLSGKYMGLSNWWLKGFNEIEEIMKKPGRTAKLDRA